MVDLLVEGLVDFPQGGLGINGHQGLEQIGRQVLAGVVDQTRFDLAQVLG